MSGSQTRAFQGGSPEPKKKKRNADDIDLEPACPLWLGLTPPKKQGLVRSKQGSFGFTNKLFYSRSSWEQEHHRKDRRGTVQVGVGPHHPT